ncbi:GIY-YIG nuclease family protein [Streptomyces sp. NPDC057250]|uniref:GIY-YIG nuclease family protein n=1 Tax=Streptomyces sp. NPDC057250 TaxID=3346068 RepID=UPI00363A235F
MGIVPEMLRRAVDVPAARPRVVLTDVQVRHIRRAPAVPIDLSGNHASRVYFIEHGTRLKIGYTTNLRSRLSALSLRPSNVRMVVRGGPEVERALHRYFDAYRIEDTEWFHLADEVQQYIEERLREHEGRPVWQHPAPARRIHLPLIVASDATELVTLTAEAIGTDNGVHLRSLLGRVGGVLGIPNTGELRACLEAEGIPCRRSFRTREGAGRTGVHRNDLLQLPTVSCGTLGT